jgi:hypothetical protein
MERAARRIEYAQGWQTESNTWSEINERGELVRKPYSHENAVPQKVRDMENLTGEQSAIRKAQNALKDKLKGLSTWEDFYNLLSLKGMKYQKKGSGAVITIDDVTVKASDVSRNLTLCRLEKQLGPFQEVHHLAQIIYDDKSQSKMIPQPLDDANRDNENWNAYISERKDYLKNQKERRERHCMTQRGERESLDERQKAERDELSGSFPKGVSRRVVYERSSILRTKHAYEKASLKAAHAEQRNRLKNLGDSYSSYEKWLRCHELDDEAEKWRHRKDGHILIIRSGDAGKTDDSPANTGILGFTMAVTKRGAVFTSVDASRDGKGAASFIDMGKVIKVYREDDNSLLAALQLARQKWGAVQINGSDEYKRRCAEIAAKNGIKVVNPELHGIVRVWPEKPGGLVRMAHDEAVKYRESWVNRTVKPRIERFEREMAEKLKSLREAERAAAVSLEGIKRRKPEEGLFDALPILRRKHEDKLNDWRREMREAENLIESTRGDIRNHPLDLEAGLEHIAGDAAKEFDSLNPSTAAVIRDEEIRAEREKQERERKERESYRNFRASIQELAANFGKQASIVTNAQDGRGYSGLMLGVAAHNGHYYAAHYLGDGHVILHSVSKEELPQISAVAGERVEISCRGGRIGEMSEEPKRPERGRRRSR